MPFYVYGRDRPGALAEMEALAEAHWSYMDRFADRLILRGPTLSDDGNEHTGSVHVVDLDDRAAAERFAAEEPYRQAGLYRHVTVARTVVLHHHEPAGGPPVLGAPDALVTGQWSPQPRHGRGPGLRLPAAGPGSRVGFVAVLTGDDQSCTMGIVVVVRALPGEAASTVQPFADQLGGGPVALTAQRWIRGGRR
jgi:hypothetical protein